MAILRRGIAFQGMFFAVKYLENPKEVSQLQNIMHRRTQAEQNEVLLQVPSFPQGLDQSGDPRTVNIADPAHVERKPGSRRHCLEQCGA